MDETPGLVYTAEIISVTDADTLVLEFNGSEQRTCRLFGIDAPETVYASTVWASVYDQLPAELQTQEWGTEAVDRFEELLISNTGAGTPVGLDVTVVIRDTDIYDRLIVTIQNNENQDVGAQMVLSGHAVVWDTYADDIPSLYATYKDNENIAQDQNLVMWSGDQVYNPWDYRSDVEEAAKALLYIVVDESQPSEGYTAAYLDDHIVLIFNKEIEASYVSSDYFRLWRTNSSRTEFYEQLSCSISKDDLRVIINPEANLSADQYYMVIALGGDAGVTATDGYKLEANYVLGFRTTDTVRPVTDTETQITHVDLWVDGDSTDNDATGPRDYFSTTGADTHIVLLSSIPDNYSVGVADIDKLIFLYDDTIANIVPREALYGRWNHLPVDSDPLGAREVYISGARIEENRLTFDTEDITFADSLNKEYVFRLAKGTVRGNNKERYDPDEHFVRFMGKLTPLYTTPDQIQMRLAGYLSDRNTGVSDYDLYKIIHEKSVWTDAKLGVPSTTEELIERGRLVNCLVLYDLIAHGAMLGGGLKSRSLLMTQVEYYGPEWNSILKELDDCIRTGLSTYSGEVAAIAHGIKSGTHLNRQGKWYNVYR